MDSIDRQERSFITSLARGLNLLEALAQAGKPLSLTELSKSLDFSKVTTTRFCHTLIRLGYIEKTPAKQYQLTPKVLNLGYAVICGYDLCRIAEPYLRELSLKLDETVNMAVLDGTEILYVARFKTEQILAEDLRIGSRLPAYCTSMGKALLAHLPEDELQRLIERTRFARLTHNTPGSPQALAAELQRVRESGFAVNDEELAVGLRSVAAPVFRNDHPAAAVNIAVPTTRYSRDDMVLRLVPPLLDTVRTISKLLGNQVVAMRA